MSTLSPLLIQLVEKMQAAVLVTERDLEPPGPTIVYANQAFCDQSGYTRDELMGRNPRLLQGPRTSQSTLNKLRVALGQGKDFAGETWNYRQDGSEYRVRWYIQHLYDEDGRVSHLFAIQEDVTRRAALLRDLLGLARASFEGLSVAGFAQLLAMEEKTCRVRARQRHSIGTLTFYAGRLVDASLGELSGEEAARTILGWERAQMDLETVDEKPATTIGEPLEFLILDSARQRDESTQTAPPVAAPSPPLVGGVLEDLSSRIPTDRLRSVFMPVRQAGARGVALIESKSGLVLASSTDPDSLDLDRLAAANSHFVRYKTRLLKVLGVVDELEDIVVTHQRSWHVLRPIGQAPSLYLFAVFDKVGGTLTLARQALAAAEASLLEP